MENMNIQFRFQHKGENFIVALSDGNNSGVIVDGMIILMNATAYETLEFLNGYCGFSLSVAFSEIAVNPLDFVAIVP